MRKSWRLSAVLATVFAVLGCMAITGGITAGAVSTSSITLYVASHGTNTGTCTSDAHPCATVTYALTKDPGGGTRATIYVSGTIADNVAIAYGKAVAPLTISQWPGGAQATIDGHRKGTVVTLGGDDSVVLDGLTVQGGAATLPLVASAKYVLEAVIPAQAKRCDEP